MLSFPRPRQGLSSLLAIAMAVACLSWLGVALGGPPNVMPPPERWPAAELFVDSAPPLIQIEMEPKAVERLRNDPRELVPAKVTEAGVLYQDVAVRLKGSIGSFRALDDKPGLTLDFARFNRSQRFHRLRRIHLNNSVEDPSFCNEQLGSEIFRAAGVPAPRVTRALVTLNGRRVGLYVLKEGFTEDFLSGYFARPGANLFEPGEGHDVNQHLKRTQIEGPRNNRQGLHRLAEACSELKPELRWQKLGASLDLDRFLSFMALEVMLEHRDGYCLARNNYRVYEEAETRKIVFFPHGMDQLFGGAQLPWEPHMAGLVAKAVIETPPGRDRYRQSFRALFDNLFRPEVLTNRVNQIVSGLRTALSKAEFGDVQTAASDLNERIVNRHIFVKAELDAPASKLLEVADRGVLLQGWAKTDPPASGGMDQGEGPDSRVCLSITALSESAASWRTQANLPPGRYRFEGRVCVREVKPLGFGTHQGAGLRLGGQTRQGLDCIGSSGWKNLKADFEVVGEPREVEFICELRARSGEAWFEMDSLRVFRTR